MTDTKVQPLRCGYCAEPARVRVTYRLASGGTRQTLTCVTHVNMVDVPVKLERRCSYCGNFDETTATHSGVDECQGCWNFRKMDQPAARHWAEVARQFLSNVDMYDTMTYLPKALEDVKNGKGEPITVTWSDMLNAVQAVALHSDRVLKDGPYHKWEDK